MGHRATGNRCRATQEQRETVVKMALAGQRICDITKATGLAREAIKTIIYPYLTKSRFFTEGGTNVQ